MSKIPQHKVFVSFHSDDMEYKDIFIKMMGSNMVNWSVGIEDIDDSLGTRAIRQKIRDEFIREATVTVILIGSCTWQRRHVDWEIGASLRDTRANPRCGLLGILLPNHPDYRRSKFDPNLFPPRFADNLLEPDPFGLLRRWHKNPDHIRRWIHKAYRRRKGKPPDNSRLPFGKNRRGDFSKGWQ